MCAGSVHSEGVGVCVGVGGVESVCEGVVSMVPMGEGGMCAGSAHSEGVDVGG